MRAGKAAQRGRGRRSASVGPDEVPPSAIAEFVLPMQPPCVAPTECIGSVVGSSAWKKRGFRRSCRCFQQALLDEFACEVTTCACGVHFVQRIKDAVPRCTVCSAAPAEPESAPAEPESVSTESEPAPEPAEPAPTEPEPEPEPAEPAPRTCPTCNTTALQSYQDECRRCRYGGHVRQLCAAAVPRDYRDWHDNYRPWRNAHANLSWHR